MRRELHGLDMVIGTRNPTGAEDNTHAVAVNSATRQSVDVAPQAEVWEGIVASVPHDEAMGGHCHTFSSPRPVGWCNSGVTHRLGSLINPTATAHTKGRQATTISVSV